MYVPRPQNASKDLANVSQSRFLPLLVKQDKGRQVSHNTPHFPKTLSTETALLRVANDILRYIDNKKSVLLILLDLSAAFDTIDHDILLARAHSRFGIDGKALYWLNAYLKNRTQTVSIDNNKATPSPLKYGVPQGSVLGPLLFTMYTAPVADIAERHGVNYHLYADDTQLYVPLDNTLETASYQKESIEKCVVEIADWMNSNKLKKTEPIIDTSIIIARLAQDRDGM
ncbi:hypothetical protein RRG08_043556 [Elysia crispata]|uniref:Reverse transcriptase domain-containing protein n=1 Tax=Elysia crispata TaxID=231223 RepID=A0AAE0YFQ9_9GAST|nr:hypothetical protein RRG08_043556 [Elysia crispata]